MSAPAAPFPPAYDCATALWQGMRPYQEDSLLADFHAGQDRGFAVLADGMGGHAAGDLASRLVVIDTASHLKFLIQDGAALEGNIAHEFAAAIAAANDVLSERAEADRNLSGMGATCLAVALFEDRLYWASVGDSPLYLWRDGRLRRLNQDHSMAPQIDAMAAAGEITAEEAASHPDRNALTSALMGGRIKAMDIPPEPMRLGAGDVLIQASDGLEYLDEATIAEILGAHKGASSREIADVLMAALRDRADPQQDNVAMLVLQLGAVGGAGAVAMAAGADRTEPGAGAAAAAATLHRSDAAPAVGGARPGRGLGTSLAALGCVVLAGALGFWLGRGMEKPPATPDDTPASTVARPDPSGPMPLDTPLDAASTQAAPSDAPNGAGAAPDAALALDPLGRPLPRPDAEAAPSRISDSAGTAQDAGPEATADTDPAAHAEPSAEPSAEAAPAETPEASPVTPAPVPARSVTGSDATPSNPSSPASARPPDAPGPDASPSAATPPEERTGRVQWLCRNGQCLPALRRPDGSIVILNPGAAPLPGTGGQ